MKKSERAKASKREDGVDFISNMPDAILLLILSRLSSTEEQLRSSILSRRWRHLWTAIPSLDMRFVAESYGGKLKRSEFKEFVYWVLTSKTVDLDRFCLDCYDQYNMATVWRWIHVAVKRNVKVIGLSCFPRDKTEAIELPHCLVNCGSLEVLRLELRFRSLSLPRLFDGFLALRVLKLIDVDLLEDDDLVKDFFKSFPLLENLTLHDCVLCKLDLLWISCRKLKLLSIYVEWENEGCNGIKISCPQLVDLELTGYITGNMFFESLDSLKQAVIQPLIQGNTEPMLFHGNSHLKPLWMNHYFSCQCIKPACDLGLPNLENLGLKSTMDAFTFNELMRSLKFCPQLENLKLHITKVFDEEYEWLDMAKTRKLLTPDVRRLELFELNGEKPELEINWNGNTLEMFFYWGDETSFSHWWL